jgi:hypothetical protein
MKNLPISEILTRKDHYIGCHEELEIEEDLIRWQNKSEHAESEIAEADAMRAALREIDQLKISGDYEAERARLAKRFKAKPMLQGFQLDPEFAQSWANLRAGMRSPDLDQRARFQRFYVAAELGLKLPRDIVNLIAVLEPAKKKRGRPSVRVPWSTEAEFLDEMRPLVANGSSIPKAARQVAAAEGKAEQDNRAKWFEKLFRDRQKMRE